MFTCMRCARWLLQRPTCRWSRGEPPSRSSSTVGLPTATRKLTSELESICSPSRRASPRQCGAGGWRARGRARPCCARWCQRRSALGGSGSALLPLFWSAPPPRPPCTPDTGSKDHGKVEKWGLELTLSSLLASWSTTFTVRYSSPFSLSQIMWGENQFRQNLCMTAALSENWMARLRAITGISNLAITKPVRMPDDET